MIFATIILGEPVGEGRPRAVRMGANVRVHAAPKSAQWRALAAQQMAERWGERLPYRDCCKVTIIAFMPRPQTRPKDVSKEAWKSSAVVWRRQKPDVDNIAKAVLDAIVQAGIIVDDTQVVDLYVARRMCDSKNEVLPSVGIIIESKAQKHESPDTGSDWANEAP